VVPPRRARRGAREREEASGKDPGTRQRGELWFPCAGCDSPAAGKQPGRDQISSDFWMLGHKCHLIAPSSSIPALHGCSGTQGLTQPHLK